jgi:hypothetical protein
MSAFTLVYGLIYLLVFNAVVGRLPPSWAWWQSGLAGLFSVILLHILLGLFGHSSAKQHQRKMAAAQSSPPGEPSGEDERSADDDPAGSPLK